MHGWGWLRMSTRYSNNSNCNPFHFTSASFATEFSHVLAYSSAEWSLGRPPSRLNSAHESTMWVIVWGWPHLHRSDADRPHLNKFAWHWPWPVRKQFSKDQSWRGRSKPGCRIVGSGVKPWLTTEADSQASLHCANMSIGAGFVQIGWLDTSRLVGGWKTSAYTGQFSWAAMCVISLSEAALRRRSGDAMLAKTGNQAVNVT